MRTVSDRSCRENQNTFYVQHIFPKIAPFFFNNVEKYGRAGHATHKNVICLEKMCLACWITKARIQTHTHGT
jgi:hypothetical protein